MNFRRRKLGSVIVNRFGLVKPETGSDWLSALGLSDVVATIRALLQYNVFIGALFFQRGLFVNNSIFSYNKSMYCYVW